MPCYSPLRAGISDGPQGRSLSFVPSPGSRVISLPCGRCIGCRIERARQWAVRIVHESKMHSQNSFLTLTYDPEHLPSGGTLVLKDVQDFLKRLRARVAQECRCGIKSPWRFGNGFCGARKLRFFLCGEYGEKLERPHYHAIIFGYDFPDKVPVKRSGEFCLYESSMLSSTWGNGSAWIGDVSFDSAAYVANYATKKITGSAAAAHYAGRKPEFLIMSRGGRDAKGKLGGIGASWIKKFGREVFSSDEVIVRGASCRPPRFYDQALLAVNPFEWYATKARRGFDAERLEEFVLRSGDVVEIAPDRNAVRLAVREKVARAKYALKRRSMESGHNA